MYRERNFSVSGTPFRNGVAVVDPKYLYGFEVYNGGGNTRNEIANIWADKYSLHKIAGSDCHTKDGAGRAGVKFINKVYDNKSLVEALRNNNYYLVERPE